MTQFISNDNFKILVDVLLDEPAIKNSPPQLKQEVVNIVKANMKPFYDKEKSQNPSISLVELNKTFLTGVLTHINKTNILTKQVYKAEDISKQRQSTLEMQMSQKKAEFDSYMNPVKPKEVNFADQPREEKIKEMDQLIAQTLAQRNYDIDKLQQNNYITNEQWLKPVDTSIKKEKELIRQVKISNQEIPTTIAMKNEIVNLDTESSSSSMNGILSKLKKVPELSEFQILNNRIDKLEQMLGEVLTLLQSQKVSQ
jgi:hypothetical protein